jgi:group I intron endonuclease
MGYIYLIRNRVNGKSYVGRTLKTIVQRFTQHKQDAGKGSECALHRSMRKHGFDSFTVEVVCQAEDFRLNDLEKHYIKLFNTRADTGYGYNMTDGGDGAHYQTEDTRARISAVQKGKKLSAEHRANISATLKGRKGIARPGVKGSKRSPESLVRMSAAQKKSYAEGRRSSNKGKPWAASRRLAQFKGSVQ